MSLNPAKLRDGRAYTGNQQFAGNGVQRSCAKCGQFLQTTHLRMKKPWGMCCPKCRGVKA